MVIALSRIDKDLPAAANSFSLPTWCLEISVSKRKGNETVWLRDD